MYIFVTLYIHIILGDDTFSFGIFLQLDAALHRNR